MEKEELEKLYYDEGLSLRDIGKKFGKSMKFTSHWLKKHGLKPRNLSDSAKIRCKLKPQSNPGRKGMPKNPKYGKEHWGFKGGYVRKDGYKIISIKGKQILEHRYVWEQHHCKIPRGYQIHHINGNKLDNRIENMRLMKNAEHQKLHEQPRGKKGQYHKT